MVEVVLAKSGVGMESGTVVEWRVQSGDEVRAGQVVAVVETDKVDVEVEAPAAGVIEIGADEGEEVAVGGVLARITPARESGAVADA
jgi:pyruvate/2-oxoglutarate dehydrogenase complex dihydrolipoamide acyltransferase (E2) component